MTNKERAIEFLHLCARGDSHEGFRRYVAAGFVHHNAYYKADAGILMNAMAENAKKFPDKLFEIRHALEDQDLVAVHSRVRLDTDSGNMAVMHIFRFEHDMIGEMWDFGQPEPEDMVNENGMF
jgi:predicted SnoaL-like aldol condensation-catalyzing enzyme